MAPVKNRFNEFQRGRTSIFDKPRPGASKTATTKDYVTKIHGRSAIEDTRDSWDSRQVKRPRGSYPAWNVGHEKAVGAMGAANAHSGQQTRNRETTSEQCLTLFKRNPKEFLLRFVTVDETWIHWYTPETKEQSKQWTSPDEPAPKKAKTVPSVGKVMATVFLDSQGVIYIEYLEKGKTVTGLYYTELLDGFAPNCRKYGPIWRRKKCSSIMATWPNWSSWATNCYPIHHVLQIWPVWLLFVEKVTRWTEICVEWGGRRRHRGLFCRPRENVFIRSCIKLVQVYRAIRRLCWEINRHFSNIFIFPLEAKYLSDHPRTFSGSVVAPFRVTTKPRYWTLLKKMGFLLWAAHFGLVKSFQDPVNVTDMFFFVFRKEIASST